MAQLFAAQLMKCLKRLRVIIPMMCLLLAGRRFMSNLNFVNSLITKVEESGDADTFFPDVDKMSNWKCIAMSATKYEGEIKYRFKYMKTLID